MRSLEFRREAVLRGEQLVLYGKLPQPGQPLYETFALPPARHAARALTDAELRRGLVIVSTLPNIERHACLAQIVELDERAAHRLAGARVVHVSSDAARHWHEVDRFHPNVRAAAYSLEGADEPSRVGFKWGFGVGVVDHQRIAHGLFALSDGVFVAAYVPYDQMQTVPVGPFLDEVEAAMAGVPCR